ncbi:S8 family serine peptidase [Streptomyces sp. NPDC058092]|uniref:S8 family serine peptidase n=1 Tax=Streptomyces sp. NPDC058092 TaxID=3346336 RepID=UPI0036E49D7B
MHLSAERIRRTAVTGAAIAVVLSLTGLPGAAGAAPTPSGPSPAGAGILPAPKQSAPSMLTLITGDKVAVTTGADGKQAVDVVAATDASKHFQISSGQDGDLYVIPEDALNAVSAQIVDRELFNVTQALKDGYGDAKTDAVPAIVDFRGKGSAAGLRQQAEALPGTEDERTMPRLGLAAVHVDKSAAKDFWRSVRPTAGKARSGSDAMVPGTAGVTKLWYDGRAKATLDQSVPQIGAPEAWAKGFDGKGAKVAVLDTGADLNNADITSRITASQSFVPGEAVQDGHGHGTHVASTIAGSGANSGGTYKGVAPGADLLVGKVLANAGSGPVSGILEGMDWAVAQGADVVSMSLGAKATAPGGDVLTNAVDSLSASSGTLFVIAAGNDGKDGQSTLGTPGIADAALTVGAVDKSDALASFSSRGPRLGDMKIKPEITAPGVNIVAARAAGTTMGTPVDAHYTAASGTSMATPHVAGAAAILAQHHPDWSGERIKEELTAHSKKSDNYTPYQQGYGRVDIPAALDPALDLSGTGDFGLVKWQKTYEKETRTVTIHNSTSSAATLDFAASVKDADGTALPGGALTLSGPDVTGGKVTVPAGGNSEVTVTLDPNGLKAGQFSGYITATGADGESVHTPVGFVMSGALTVKFTDRFGKTPGRVQLTLHGMDNRTFQNISLRGQGSTTVTLPAGAYSVEGVTYTEAPGDPTRTYAIDGFSIPDIDVTDQDVTRSVDGTKATDFTVKVTGEKRPLENASWMMLVDRSDGAGGHHVTLGEAGLINGSDAKIGAVPTARPTTGDLHLFNALTQREPITQLSVTSPERISVPVVTPGFAQRFEGTKGLRLADAGSGTAEGIAAADLKGRAALITVANLRKMDDEVRRAAAAGATAVIAVPAGQGPLFNGSLAADQTIPVAIASHDNGEKLRTLLGKGKGKGKVSIALKGVLESGYTYHMPLGTSGIPADLTRTVDAADFARVRNAYHADGVRHQGEETLHSWAPGQPTSFRAGQPLNMGATRDDYRLAGSNLAYNQVVYPSTAYRAYMTGPFRATYPTAGKTYRESWLAAPTHPPMEDPSICAFCRSDVWTRTTGTIAGDSDPAHSLVATPPTLTNTWTFYRNGEQITDTSKLMVPEKAQYRFVQEVARDKDYLGVTLGGKVRTEWNFASAAPTTMAVKDCEKYSPKPTVCESLPAVMLGYDVPLDILNQAPAGRPYTFTVNAGRPKGWSGSTAMAGAKVSVSYDDGASWKNAEIKRTDDNSFRVSVHHPKLSHTNGYVTLRTEVWDAAGNRTVQTVNRAYALK